MYETTYHRPASVAEAVSLFSNASDGRFLAGGQTLIPTMKQRLAAPSDVIDVGKIAEMRGIEVSGDTVSIGAAMTHAEVAASEAVRGAIPALAGMAGMIGDPAVRHRGTLGGSLANNDPAADYPAGVLALGATIHTDKREIAAEDFFQGMFSTALEDGEVITRVVFQVPEKAAYAKFRNPASGYAMAGVFVARMKDGAVRVGVTGASGNGVFRSSEIEQALLGSWSAEAIAPLAISPEDMLSDIHGSAAYRANLVKVMARRAVASIA
ncbi:MAG: xanthine dehydrogenase family protein subunit M [Bauldia sp.]|uniref:FAD binding domain-containing protein n=1 Tax=Bauldia sp. TaxID=2575872 RepID=UPI001DE5C344|nr:xanthine dehydrogenase family protein subunit M [Bauldia sp.]MCB1497050.1 xanthine dehydrogenase family protein subunit M [Bauldia sp.]